MRAVNFLKPPLFFFFVIDQVHFELDSVRALGPVEPCSTFHTVSTKSYKKDWLWEVWHESWLHNMKSYSFQLWEVTGRIAIKTK